MECTVKEMQLHGILFIELRIALKFELFHVPKQKVVKDSHVFEKIIFICFIKN